MIAVKNLFLQESRALELMGFLGDRLEVVDMSTGKLLNETVLHGFNNHPRDLLKELIIAAKTQYSKATTKEDATAWRKVIDKLIEAYNVAPSKR